MPCGIWGDWRPYTSNSPKTGRPSRDRSANKRQRAARRRNR
jgi:hypothetical protein